MSDSQDIALRALDARVSKLEETVAVLLARTAVTPEHITRISPHPPAFERGSGMRVGCAVCRRLFKQTRPWQKYCSDRCKYQARSVRGKVRRAWDEPVS